MRAVMEWLDRFLFPQQMACHVCHSWPELPGILCNECIEELRKLQFGRNMMRMAEHPPLLACISAWDYDSVVREMIRKLKYHGDEPLAGPLGEGMSRALSMHPDVLDRIQLIVPVPVHPRRLDKRGYNQAGLLAEKISFHTGIPLESTALYRKRYAKSQVHRTRAQRLKAMRDTFAVHSSSVFQGSFILLVDDVLTTGATAVACAEKLYQAGAKEVYLLTAARA